MASTAQILRALGDEGRLKLLLRLLQEPATQKELGAASGLASGTVSRRLRELEALGLIARERSHGSYTVVHWSATHGLLQAASALAESISAADRASAAELIARVAPRRTARRADGGHVTRTGVR